eukprot:TRINITY_DN432_c0_g1_i1.p1 TRINITY_DN432_c0_g1~~TRINITY_DN432_c0_g1_i1.p1  ORF type:complete len:352 (-),score=88.13 TRINITY_DN432_c0_g1_i1:13-1005(-)
MGELLDLTLPNYFTVGVRVTFGRDLGEVILHFKHAAKEFEVTVDSSTFRSFLVPAASRLDDFTIHSIADGKAVDNIQTIETVKLDENYSQDNEMIFGVDNDIEEVNSRDYRNLDAQYPAPLPENIEQIIEEQRQRSGSNAIVIGPPEQMDLEPPSKEKKKISKAISEQLQNVEGTQVEHKRGKLFFLSGKEDVLLDVSTQDKDRFEHVMKILYSQKEPVEVSFTIHPGYDIEKRRALANAFRGYRNADETADVTNQVQLESAYSASGYPIPLMLVYSYRSMQALHALISRMKSSTGVSQSVFKNLARGSWLGTFVVPLDKHHTVMIQAYF